MKKSQELMIESYVREVISEIKVNRSHPTWEKLSNFFRNLVSSDDFSDSTVTSFENLVKGFVKEVNSTRSQKLNEEEMGKIFSYAEKAVVKMKEAAKRSEDPEEEKKKIPEKLKSVLNSYFSNLKYAD